MTSKELIEEAAKLGPWRLRDDMIRCARGLCPIVAVATARGKKFSNATAEQAGKFLGLSPGVTHRIIYAADDKYQSLRLRKQMERELLKR